MMPHSPEGVIDIYLNALNILKEKVCNLLTSYQLLIEQKIDCEMGNLVYCNTDVFQRQYLAEVFAQLDEVQVQLSGLEVWSGLPPDCFAPSFSGLTLDTESEQATNEAQALVDAVHRLQHSLRQLISRSHVESPTKPPSHPDVYRTERESSATCEQAHATASSYIKRPADLALRETASVELPRSHGSMLQRSPAAYVSRNVTVSPRAQPLSHMSHMEPGMQCSLPGQTGYTEYPGHYASQTQQMGASPFQRGCTPDIKPRLSSPVAEQRRIPSGGSDVSHRSALPNVSSPHMSASIMSYSGQPHGTTPYASPVASVNSVGSHVMTPQQQQVGTPGSQMGGYTTPPSRRGLTPNQADYPG